MGEHELPIRRACRAVGLSRTAWYRRPEDQAEKDREVVDALQRVLEGRPRWGFWKCYDRLRLDGRQWNHKRVRRVYRSLGLNLPRRTKRRAPRRALQILEAPAALNRVWALDFMHDRLYGSGRPFRTLNVVDEANREGLAIEAGTSIPAARVVRVMEQLEEMYGLPSAIRVDNGPEFLAEVFQSWCADHGIEMRFIRPGKPNQNAFVERFNKSYREEILDAYLFVRASRRCRSSLISGCLTTTITGRTTRSEAFLRRAICRGPQPRICLLQKCVLKGDAYGPTSARRASPDGRTARDGDTERHW